MKNLIIFISFFCAINLSAQINYTGWKHVTDSLNYALTNDTVTIETPNIEYPYRWEVYFATTPLDTAVIYSNWELADKAKNDLTSPVWYVADEFRNQTPDTTAQKINGSSLGGVTKFTVIKATANKGMRVKARIHWIKADVNYDNLVVPQP